MQTHAEIPASPLPLGLCYGSLCALDADALVAVAGEAGFTSVMLPPFPESACGTRAEFRIALPQTGHLSDLRVVEPVAFGFDAEALTTESPVPDAVQAALREDLRSDL